MLETQKSQAFILATKQASFSDASFLSLNSLSLAIDVSHDFANLFLTWSSTHLSEHHTNHLLIDWRVLLYLFFKQISGDKERADSTNEERTNNRTDCNTESHYSLKMVKSS